MYISKRYLLALALVGAVVFGFVSHQIADQLGVTLSGVREASPPGSVAASPVLAAPSPVVLAAPPGAPVPAPIVAQPGGGGSTTNIYLTIVNTPGGTSATPPSVNVVPGP